MIRLCGILTNLIFGAHVCSLLDQIPSQLPPLAQAAHQQRRATVGVSVVQAVWPALQLCGHVLHGEIFVLPVEGTTATATAATAAAAIVIASNAVTTIASNNSRRFLDRLGGSHRLRRQARSVFRRGRPSSPDGYIARNLIRIQTGRSCSTGTPRKCRGLPKIPT